MDEQTWELGEQTDESLIEDQEALDSGPGSEAGPDAGAASGEGTEALDAVVERVMAQLGTELERLRQDLQEDLRRQVQSFSDKTAHRLSQQQRERLKALDEALKGLEEQLGPDFEQIKRQKQLEILLDAGSEESPEDGEEQAPTGETSPQSDFAQVYLSRKLGDPSEWSREERAAIQRELTQARDWAQWMAVVDKYAGIRAGRQRGGSDDAGAQTRRAARAQPSGGRARGSRMDLAALQKAYNQAAADRDLARMQQLGEQIDKLIQQGG